MLVSSRYGIPSYQKPLTQPQELEEFCRQYIDNRNVVNRKNSHATLSNKPTQAPATELTKERHRFT